MTKSKDSRKDAKKAPVKSLKEKRADKHSKKEAGAHVDFLAKSTHGSAH